MIYKPTKKDCKRLGIPNGSILSGKIENVVLRKRNYKIMKYIYTYPDIKYIGMYIQIKGWKLASKKHKK